MKTICKVSLGILAITIIFSCEKEDVQLSSKSEIQTENYSFSNIYQSNVSLRNDDQAEYENMTLILDTSTEVVIDGPTNYLVPAESIVTTIIVQDEEIEMLAGCDIIGVSVSWSLWDGWCVAFTMGDEAGAVSSMDCSGNLGVAAATSLINTASMAGCN